MSGFYRRVGVVLRVEGLGMFLTVVVILIEFHPDPLVSAGQIVALVALVA